MAVVFDAVGPSSSGTSTNASSPITWTHTASGTNRAVIVGISQDNNALTPGEVTATYGGVSMTALGSCASGSSGGTDGAAWLFGLVNPPTGVQTVSVQRSGHSYGFIGGSVSFTGVNQSTPFSNAIAISGDNPTGSTPPSGSVSSATGNMVIDIVVYGSAISNATGTLRWINNIDGATGAHNAAQSTYSGASSVTVGYNPTLHDMWAIVAVNINAAATATPLPWLRF